MNGFRRASDVAFKWMTILGGIILILFVLYSLLMPNFVRGGPSKAGGCINNLRQIDGATQQWALDNKRKPETNVAWNDITPYLKLELTCPQGGKYTIGPTVSNAPTCSIT